MAIAQIISRQDDGLYVLQDINGDKCVIDLEASRRWKAVDEFLQRHPIPVGVWVETGEMVARGPWLVTDIRESKEASDG